jgi:hypothetical protein
MKIKLRMEDALALSLWEDIPYIALLININGNPTKTIKIALNTVNILMKLKKFIKAKNTPPIREIIIPITMDDVSFDFPAVAVVIMLPSKYPIEEVQKTVPNNDGDIFRL